MFLSFQSTEPPDLPHEPVTVGAGAADASAPEKEPAPASIPTAIKYQDDNSLAHPNVSVLVFTLALQQDGPLNESRFAWPNDRSP